MANCTYAVHQPSGAEAPFDYFAFKGGQGTLVPPETDQASGLCFFPTATCAAGQVPTGSSCCTRTQYAEGLPSLSSYSTLMTLGLFFLYCYPRCKACKRRFGTENERQRQAQRATRSGKWAMLGALFMAISIGLSVTLLSTLAETTQQMLSVGERNVQIIAESVLDPMKDIFSFIDDILLVKVGTALAANDKRQIRAVFLLGTGGGFFLGCLGAGCACLVFINSVAQAVFNPFATSACTLADGSTSAGQMYFILGALQWPFLFANFAFSGFAIAFGDFAIYGLVITVQTALQLILLLTVFKSNPSIVTLGWMALLQAFCGFLLWSVNLALRPELRERMGLSSRRVPAGEQGEALVRQGTIPVGFWSDPNTKAALKDGVCAMLVEISVEFSRTIALYVAAQRLGVGAFYQLSAHYSLQYTQGLALAEGAFMNMKLQGAEMMGKGQHAVFTWLIEFVAVFAAICVIVCSFNIFYSRDNLIFSYGSTACAFASQGDCLSEYAHFYGGMNTVSMFSTIYTVPLAVLIKCMYKIARSALYALQDFEYMVKVSTVGFFLLFLPAVIAMAFLPTQSPLVAILVMMIPYLAALVPFWVRLNKHVKELVKGPPNPNEPGRLVSWDRRPTTSWRNDGNAVVPDHSWRTQGTQEQLEDPDEASFQFATTRSA